MKVLKVEMVSVDSLVPYENNSKIHTEKQIGQIAASIKEFGFNSPLLADGEKGIIAGHGRQHTIVKRIIPSHASS